MRSENLEIPGFNRELCGTWYTCVGLPGTVKGKAF